MNSNPEVFEKLRLIVYKHGMIEVLNSLPSFFVAAYDAHDLDTLTHMINARDSYRVGYQKYHDLREQEKESKKEENIKLLSLYEQVISRINKLDDDTREAKGHLNILVLDRFLADITKLVGENEVKKKAIFKYNNSHGALLCSGCRVILKDGSSFSDEEMEAFQGATELEAQYCNTCKAGEDK
jgi:hypothetical protein